MNSSRARSFGFCREIDQRLFSILKRISADDTQARWIVRRLVEAAIADFTENRLPELVTACNLPRIYAVCYSTTTRRLFYGKHKLYFVIIFNSVDQRSYEVLDISKARKKDITGLKTREFYLEKPDQVDQPPPLLVPIE